MGRTTRMSVTFSRPFSLVDVDGIQPAGTYRVQTVDVALESMSVVGYRRVSTTIELPGVGTASSRRQVVTIDPLELDAAKRMFLGRWKEKIIRKTYSHRDRAATQCWEGSAALRAWPPERRPPPRKQVTTARCRSDRPRTARSRGQDMAQSSRSQAATRPTPMCKELGLSQAPMKATIIPITVATKPKRCRARFGGSQPATTQPLRWRKTFARHSCHAPDRKRYDARRQLCGSRKRQDR